MGFYGKSIPHNCDVGMEELKIYGFPENPVGFMKIYGFLKIQ